jgi:hypothetical protein
MATAAPHVKLLRQLASAKDDYLSGAFDISWDGAKATLYLVFGRPSHAVFETDQAQIEGEAAIDALLAALPKVFVVSDWRRAMSPHETLSITIDELAGPFVRLAGSYADDPVAEETPEWWSAVDDSPDLPFGLADFPLMPGGRPLWVEASPDEVRLADRLSGLPPSILILTGAKLRAAAVVSGGDLIDAVWIDADDHARGETAGMALLGATKGSLAGYALDDPRVAEALTMLWRLPLAVRDVDLSWLDPASMLAAFRADGLDRVLVIDAPVRGIALISRGGLVAVYSETQRSAVASPERLRSLLSQARGRLTVMERKPRPLATEAAAPASAYDYFEVSAPETVAVPVNADSMDPVEGSGAGAAGTEAAPDAAGMEATHDAALDSAAPPPPPPLQEETAPDGAEAPPPLPPAVEAPEGSGPETAEQEHKAKRSRWGFGRSRRSRADRRSNAAGVSDSSTNHAGGDTATFAGWSVREQNPDPEPVWHRSQDTSADAPLEETAPVVADAEPSWTPDSEPEAVPEAEHAPEAEAVPEGEAAPEAEAVPEVEVSPEAEATPEAEAVPEAEVAPEAEAGPEAEAAPEAEIALEAAAQDATSLDEPAPEPAPAPSEEWLMPSWLDDVVSGDAVQAETEAQLSSEDDTAQPDDLAAEPESTPVVPTPGPWSWPLAEPEESTGSAPWTPSGSSHPSDDVDAGVREPAAVAAPLDEGSKPAIDNGSEPGFFHRDDPVGSQYVDFDEVRSELVQIGIVWLGETNAVQVTALLSSTRSTIDDFVATIDTIRGLHLEGQDPASIQAMAREMHQQAAERLCGA